MKFDDRLRETMHLPISNDQIGPIMVAMLTAEQARLDKKGPVHEARKTNRSDPIERVTIRFRLGNRHA